MKIKCLVFLLMLSVHVSLFAQLSVTNLLCENLNNPAGIDEKKPRLSWQLKSEKRNTMQTAYEIKVNQADLPNAIFWNSGKVNSDQSVYVPFGGGDLKTNQKYIWQVRVWDNYGNRSNWSTPASWQMGITDIADWKAKWIESVITNDSSQSPAIYFRKSFNLNKKIQNATAYITTHGMYEAQLNGKRIGNAYLTPGWTSYKNRLQYQTYDVTNLLNSSANAIGVTVGSGWYRTALGWGDNKNLYGKKLGLLLQIFIKYQDGTTDFITSDNSWKSSNGAIRFSEIYDGEVYDANFEIPGWSASGFDDSKWEGVTEKDFAKNILLAAYNEPVLKHEIFKPVKIFKTPAGEQVIDFGQNLVGWEQIKLKGKKGDTVTISHAEVLDKTGNFYTENLRAARAQNIYILNGKDDDIFEPHFTFQGFRYIKIEGLKTEPNLNDFTAVAMYSSMKPTGDFTCSDSLLNQLQHNIQWGQKGNFLDVPTDCPQRDERLGWTGDAQAFSRTATFNMQVHNFFSKWMKDVAADQEKDGRVPFVIPDVLGAGSGGSAGWSDVATIIPWNVYLAYGDKKILEDQYASMKLWVSFMQANSKNYLWNTGFHFGDWLFYRPFDDNDGRSAVTDKYLIAQCFYAYSTQLLINAANVLGKEDDAKTYTELLHNIKQAFIKEYTTESGRLVSGTQTAYVLALNFDMLPDSLRAQAAARLAENVASYDNHLTTGFLGTPYLCHVLSRFGYDSVSYKLLLQQSYPSWLYPVKMGATTIWERWDGEKPDSTFQTPGMNSFNHYAYGAIGDWMYRVMCGLDTDDKTTGYKKIIIKPHPGGNLSYASASLDTYYGRVKSAWKRDSTAFHLSVEIPANTTATIYLPATKNAKVDMNGKPVVEDNTASSATSNNYRMINVGSGTYDFTVK